MLSPERIQDWVCYYRTNFPTRADRAFLTTHPQIRRELEVWLYMGDSKSVDEFLEKINNIIPYDTPLTLISGAIGLGYRKYVEQNFHLITQSSNVLYNLIAKTTERHWKSESMGIAQFLIKNISSEISPDEIMTRAISNNDSRVIRLLTESDLNIDYNQAVITAFNCGRPKLIFIIMGTHRIDMCRLLKHCNNTFIINHFYQDIEELVLYMTKDDLRNALLKFHFKREIVDMILRDDRFTDKDDFFAGNEDAHKKCHHYNRVIEYFSHPKYLR